MPAPVIEKVPVEVWKADVAPVADELNTVPIMSPATVSAAEGVVVPMPTLPDAKIVILVMSLPAVPF